LSNVVCLPDPSDGHVFGDVIIETLAIGFTHIVPQGGAQDAGRYGIDTQQVINCRVSKSLTFDALPRRGTARSDCMLRSVTFDILPAHPKSKRHT